jgi:response regulator RpfG family c-di-GMP phosphodiesterase
MSDLTDYKRMVSEPTEKALRAKVRRLEQERDALRRGKAIADARIEELVIELSRAEETRDNEIRAHAETYGRLLADQGQAHTIDKEER